MSQYTELQSFLPKSSLDSDSVTVAGTSQARLSSRIKVRFITKNTNPTYTNIVSQVEAVFVFGPDSSIQQAAEYAASHYPATESLPAPIFNEVSVFFSDSSPFRLTRMAVPDVGANVHSMFKEDDTMIVSNDPNIFAIQAKQTNHELAICWSSFLGFLAAIITISVWLFSP